MFSRVLRANRYSKISRFRRFTKTIKKKRNLRRLNTARERYFNYRSHSHSISNNAIKISLSLSLKSREKRILLVDSTRFSSSNGSSREEFSISLETSKPRRISKKKIYEISCHFVILILTLHVRLIKSATDFSTLFYLHASSLFREHLALNSSYTQGKQCPCDRRERGCAIHPFRTSNFSQYGSTRWILIPWRKVHA